MSRVDLEDVDVINIAQLWATVAQDDPYQKEIMKRMSDKAVDWYIHNLVPVVGRPTIKYQFGEIRKSK